MRKYRHILLSVAASWQLLMDLPRQPGRRRAPVCPEARVRGRRILGGFPLLATVNGLLLACAGLLVEALSDRYVGAAAFALLTLIYMFVRHSGRGWVMIVSWILNLCDGYGFFEALSAARSDRSELDRDWGWGAIFALALLLLGVLFLLGRFGSPFFMAALLSGSSVVQGQLLLMAPPEEGGVTDPKWIGRLIMWGSAILFGVVWCFFFPAASALAGLLILLTMCWIGGNLRNALSSFGTDTAAWTEAMAELSMLIGCFLLTM